VEVLGRLCPSPKNNTTSAGSAGCQSQHAWKGRLLKPQVELTIRRYRASVMPSGEGKRTS
jgi:hypothetical protein